MQQATTQTSNNDRQQKQQPQTKQTWHRPTVTFVPLQTTADFTGSGTDASTQETI